MSSRSRTGGTFARELERRNPDPEGRSWLYVPYDQLSDRMGPLSREDPEELGIILIENSGKAALRPYHKQKLALILGNQRRFALEQAERGVGIRYLAFDGPYRGALETLLSELGTVRAIRVMTPAERELREDLAPLISEGKLEQIPHEGWLTTRDQFLASQKSRPWRMDSFYRLVRKQTGWLMDNGKPRGGKFSFDSENRKPWPGKPDAPDLPIFPSDPVKEEVVDLVATRFADHPGRLDPPTLPTTAADADRLWSWAQEHCLPLFGPYEDAMSTRTTNLFHTRLSSLLHLHRILPRQVVDDVLGLDLPLAGLEGFLRQVVGWREFMRHVHVETDGFRDLDPSGAPSFLGAGAPLPPALWGKPSGLACLDHVVQSVWDEGYSHHITRLMVISNLSTLLDLSPRELTDWFWVAYTDAFDWVVEPNVLGMGTFACGDLMTTKPYVSGAAYINRMSDYCSGCEFDPKKTCPITPMYWAFLARHRKKLDGNPRLRMPMASLNRRNPERRKKDTAVFEHVTRTLQRGDRLDPEKMADLQ